MISKLKHANRVITKQLVPLRTRDSCLSCFNFSTIQQGIVSQPAYQTGRLNQQKRVLFNDEDEENLIDNENDNDNENDSNNNNDQNDESNNNNNNNNKNNNLNQSEGVRSNLKAIPMRNWKATDLTEEELLVTPTTHIIFSSQQPILPFSKMPCKMNTGNLTEINHELGYFILNQQGDVFQIGLELEKNVAKQISKSFAAAKNPQNTSSTGATSETETKDNTVNPTTATTSTTTAPASELSSSSTETTTTNPPKPETTTPPNPETISKSSTSSSTATGNTTQTESQTPPLQSPPRYNAYSQECSVDLAPKKLSHRLKIIEIEFTNQGIFAKTIPYKDDKAVLKVIEKINLERELFLVRSLVISIKKSIAFEKIEVIGSQEIESANLSDATPEQIDRMIFSILSGVLKLYSKYMKEHSNVLIQTILESKSYAERVMLLRLNLESLNEVMELVNRHFKMADDSMIRMQTQNRARLSIEFIKQAFFGNDKQATGGVGGMAGGHHGQMGAHQQQNASQMQKLIQGYLSKLHLIEDKPSQERVRQEIDRFSSIDKHSSEFNKINTYLDEVFSVPWNKFTPSNWDISYAKKVLDEEIFGLEKVKERIIEMIAVNQMKNTHARSKGFILLLQGPPGTGKTSIAKAIAKALQKQSRFISFAGISDSSFFKGHRRTYVDSQPGVFIKEMIKAQTMNPVLILDEIDKISKSSMGSDPYYSLMEILNPEENSNFTDHYLDIKVDFSNTIFILTANDIMSMLEPLKNRLEIIEIPAYIEEEKLQISKKFIIPKAIEGNGMHQSLLKISDQSIQFIIKNWCYEEAGVRGLKRCFEMISRKYAVELLSQNKELVKIQQEQQQTANVEEKIALEETLKKAAEKANQNQASTTASTETKDTSTVSTEAKDTSTAGTATPDNNNKQSQMILNSQTIEQLNLPVLDLTDSNTQMDTLKKYLGVPAFDAELDSRQTVQFAPGTVNILSVGGFVGHVMKIECVFDNSQVDKKGQFTSSGNLKQVLQESLTIAKINAFSYLTDDKKKTLAEKNVHIHFMSGSIPKDGPSAGIAICTAYLSLATGKPVPANLAMTGELSPIGEVCKIGGLQAKIIAAKTLNINTIICPYSNIGDVHDFPALLLQGISIYFVREYKQVYEIVFEEKRLTQVPKGVIVLKDGTFLTNPLDIPFEESSVAASIGIQAAAQVTIANGLF